MTLPFFTPEEKMNYFDLLEVENKNLAWTRLHDSIIEAGEIDDNMEPGETYEEAAEGFWEIWLDNIDPEFLEDALIESLDELPNFMEIFHDFHKQYGRDPEEILRKREIEAEKMRRYQDAFRKSMEGDDAPLEEYYQMSPGTLKARNEGRRIAKRVGKCYVCSKELPLGQGELLLEYEVPTRFRHLGSHGSTATWFTRCYEGPCSDPSLGKRIFEVGHRIPRTTPNKLPDTCFVCGDEVAETQGFLVHYTAVPPKLRKKMPWKNAKYKKYYVICKKTEPELWI
jgi:hypothetical protein